MGDENNKKEQIFCIFNKAKEKPSKKVSKAFEVYIKEMEKLKEHEKM